ncbi:M20/M25/M40 family metallo-hydrolase [Salinimicrobium oceani]|uniref:Vacuolar membrane protease n=1 Tax=Salinimicrobium oceani TaxID=2722702 RepID=A0ABX1CZA9_9FLAO|nr:M20/M25/M40 family metallo-hydrolase [Salinimicrobium oceani]NJW52254.1 M20/M25/M40 family metallo-hydrolase [Salinimicrobium oceani]
MSKNIQAIASVLILLAAVIWSLTATRPAADLSAEVPLEDFSTARAFQHVEAMAQEPHYVGSSNHRLVRNYIVSQLEEMGLLVETHEGFSMNSTGILTRPQNIMARVKGKSDGKALLLMSHYDSAMHSSPGASDAASGVATILEGVRAFLASGKTPENDIILLFTDAEELGLNGADLFVEEHPWAEEVGLALNFESRGSGGNSFMLLETNAGNKALLDLFSNAGVQYPVTNSLAYSVYKMLPNDTDLTVLREQGNINGLNFAFIDDHFDYHTATDVPANLDPSTLAHQGSYLMPLLHYSAGASLEDLSSQVNVLFFNVPGLGLFTYPYSWIYPLLFMAIILLLVIIGFGKMRQRFQLMQAVKGFVPLLLALVLSGLLSYFFWYGIQFLYPHYQEMEHGFTYNGYWYIGAVAFLSLAVCFYVYHRFRKPENAHHLLVAPLLLWLIICTLAAVYLEGAAYFIILVYFGLLQLLFLILDVKWKFLAVGILSLPAIFILMPFIVSFPVALGLGMVFLTAILIALLFPLLWPLFSAFRNNQLAGFLSFLVFMVFFVIAHFKSDFSEDRPRPNSLVYLMDEDRNVATWNTYDHSLDTYTRPYFAEAAVEAPAMHWFGSKNGSQFTWTAVAPEILLPAPYISVEKMLDSTAEVDTYQVKIAPNREINRIELFADRTVNFKYLKANNKEAKNLQTGEDGLHIHKNRWRDKFLTYYAVSQDTLRLELSLEKGMHPEITLLEAAYTLHDNPQLKVTQRPVDMIPRPFVLNDAIVVKKTFKLE